MINRMEHRSQFWEGMRGSQGVSWGRWIWAEHGGSWGSIDEQNEVRRILGKCAQKEGVVAAEDTILPN